MNNFVHSRSRQKPRLWWLMMILSTAIALYGMTFVIRGERMFPVELAASFRSRPWALYLHAFFAAIALFIGPLQFHRGLLVKRRLLHRTLGKVYVISAIAGSGLAGGYLSFYSFGGWPTHLGFGLLSLLTTLTTVIAYVRIRERRVVLHREWMIRSYSLIFAAVTLRLWIPILMIAFSGQFSSAYLVVSWLAWVPNILLAELFIAKSRSAQNADTAKLLVV